MRRTSLTEEAQSWLLVIAVVGAALVYGPWGGADGFVISKATLVVLAAILAAVIGGLAAVRSAVVKLPWHPAIAAVGVLTAAMMVRVAVAEDPLRGVLGYFGRWNGLALYLACFVLFVVAASAGTDPAARRFLRSLVVGGIVVALYGLDDAYLGLGPDWGARRYVAGTLGNSNFFGAWVACVLGPSLALMLDRSEARGWRLTGAFAVPLLLWGVQASGAEQALFVVALVTAVVALAWVADRVRRSLFVSLTLGVTVAAAAGVLLTVLGAMGRGPASFLADQGNVQRRLDHWKTAGRMIAEHPVGGVGPALFQENVRMFRSAEEAMFNPALERIPGSVHNVPLQIFAEWGTLVGLTYVAVFVLVLVALIREIKHRSAPSRLRYAGLAAAWLGYLLQSLVSIDSPPLAVLGWVTAGFVLAPQVTKQRGLALPWRARSHSRRSSVPAPARLSAAIVVFVGLLASWVALMPLRADAASTGGEIRVEPDSDEGPPIGIRATEIAPWESEYWMRLATVLLEEEQEEHVLAVVEQAHAVSPNSFSVVLNAARIAHYKGEMQEARAYYEKALRLEPHLPDLRTEVAQFALDQDDRSWAEELLEKALEVDPEHTEANELQDAMEAE